MSYLPIIKAILPHIATIVTAAAPMLTKSGPSSDDRQVTMADQIAELQRAVQQNNDAVRVLATQLEKAVSEVDKREAADQERLESLEKRLAELGQAGGGIETAVQRMIKDTMVTKVLATAGFFAGAASLAIVLFK